MVSFDRDHFSQTLQHGVSDNRYGYTRPHKPRESNDSREILGG